MSLSSQSSGRRAAGSADSLKAKNGQKKRGEERPFFHSSTSIYKTTSLPRPVVDPSTEGKAKEVASGEEGGREKIATKRGEESDDERASERAFRASNQVESLTSAQFAVKCQASSTPVAR